MRKLLAVFVCIILLIPGRADDGMWIPLLLDKTRYERMVELGCKLSTEDIYSVNHSSLKDAVILFDRGCSGVVVSDAGLVFTNHHCGYGAIQNHSTLEHDYLTNGFIANSRSEELPNPGITVSFLVRMDDVTDKVLKEVGDNLSEADRKAKIRDNIDMLVAEASKSNANKFEIKPLYNENQYFIYEYEVYTDVRLVAAPPSNIGKFGGDTDNWVWPRHTGDFSVFRIYADKNNRPAPYSPDNVPYKPRKFVPVSIKGVAEDDFTMVYGYPANTDQYLTAREIDLMLNLQLPQKVALRTVRLNIMQEAMQADPATRIKYAAKYAGVSNSWKKWDGMIMGLNAVNAVSQKKETEARFMSWVSQDESRKALYGSLFDKFNANYDVYRKYASVVDYYFESVLATELISQGSKLYAFLNKNYALSDTVFQRELRKYVKGLDGFYKNYSEKIDKRTFVRMMELYKKNIPTEFYPEVFTIVDKKFKG
ncbi:MAG TPA: S46 family peptidase, partial [Bacteroidales bacterium]|nr:S46 family peptidase [Bacteroidales bacterium]